MHSPLTHGQLLLSGYTYRPDVGPCWQADDFSTIPATRHVFPVWDLTFGLWPLPARYCTGTYDSATQQYVPCPHRRQVKPPYQNCYPCFEAIGFNPAFYNVPQSQLSARQQAYNRQPHCTYLAYFGPGTVKVGIAHQRRLQRRWLEQGARAAVVLRSAEDAYAARELEADVSRTTQTAERVTVVKKKKLLNVPYSFEEAADVLNQHRATVGQALGVTLPQTTVADLQHHYFRGCQPPQQPLSDADDGQRRPLTGRVVGMVGDVVVYRSVNGCWMSSLKKHVGSACIRLLPTEDEATWGRGG